MRYEGKSEIIQAIEQQIRENAMCAEHKRPKYDELFGVKSIVESKVLDVLIPKEAYLFPVRFFYDGRDNTGVIDIRDKDVWWLCKIAPEVLKLVALLQPQKEEKQELLHNHKIELKPNLRVIEQ